VLQYGLRIVVHQARGSRCCSTVCALLCTAGDLLKPRRCSACMQRALLLHCCVVPHVVGMHCSPCRAGRRVLQRAGCTLHVQYCSTAVGLRGCSGHGSIVQKPCISIAVLLDARCHALMYGGAIDRLKGLRRMRRKLFTRFLVRCLKKPLRSPALKRPGDLLCRNCSAHRACCRVTTVHALQNHCCALLRAWCAYGAYGCLRAVLLAAWCHRPARQCMWR
jgi:hypothetical protein